MSVVDDLAGAYAEREVTVPVRCGGSSTRAFFNRAGGVVKVAGFPVPVQTDTLYLQRGSLDPDLAQEALVQVGQLGAESVLDSDPLYTVAEIRPWQDDLESEVLLDGGRT